MNLASVIAVAALAILEGALVALPRADALQPLRRLRSPAWAAFLPGMIVVGTFGVLELHSIAFGLVVLAAVATPMLAIVAVLTVVRVYPTFRGQRAVLVLLVVVLAGLGVLDDGWVAQLSASVLTALGCLAFGIAIVRLIPRGWVPVGVLAMCAVDVALLALGIGQSATAVMASATAHFHGPSFDNATVGPISTDYPDLVLAAVLGGMVAGDTAVQRQAAVLVTTLVALYGLLLAFVSILPATVPIALTYMLLRSGRFRQRWQVVGPSTHRRAQPLL
jgi:hypothetical protein